ncbi:MAG: regulatory protein RecX [Mariprofundales bacterium]
MDNNPSTAKLIKAARNRALRLLAGREYCAADLRRRLLRLEFEENIIAEVIAWLQQHNWLDDKRFALAFLRSRLQRGDTLQLAAAKARRHGVLTAALQDAQDELDSSFDAVQLCSRIVNKRDSQGKRFTDKKIWARHVRYLQSHGFDMVTILRCLKKQELE